MLINKKIILFIRYYYDIIIKCDKYSFYGDRERF